MSRWPQVLLVFIVGLAGVTSSSAQGGFRGEPYSTDVPYDGRFTLRDCVMEADPSGPAA